MELHNTSALHGHCSTNRQVTKMFFFTVIFPFNKTAALEQQTLWKVNALQKRLELER
jgi:hypothetical protein